MQKLPDDLNQKFTQILIDKNLSKPEHYFCTKWLRYYWDFCHKYHYEPFLPSSLPLFLNKLPEKNQSLQQQNQAKFAIDLLYKMNLPTPGKQKNLQLLAVLIKFKIIFKITMSLQLRAVTIGLIQQRPIFHHQYLIRHH